MKIVIDRVKFQAALNIVKDVVGPGQTLQVLQNVKLETTSDEELTLTTTNLDQVLSTKVTCQVNEPGATTVPAKLLVSMVGALTQPRVEFKYNQGDQKAVLSGGDVTYRLATIDIKQFPMVSEISRDCKVIFKQDELKELLRKTSYASSVDSTRRTLTSVCLQPINGKVGAVATDGRRLAFASSDKDAEFECSIIVPTVTVKFIQRLLAGNDEVTVSFETGKAASFETKSWKVQTKLIADVYPAWGRVLEGNYSNSIQVDREQFINSVRQVSLASDASNGFISIEINEGVMTFAANAADVTDAKAMIPVKYDGEKVRIHFNPRYLQETFGAFDEDVIVMEFTDGGAMAKFTAVGSSATSLVMPLRIN